MRTQTVLYKVYTINELSDKAKERAYHDWLNETDYPWADDNVASLKAFESIFPIKVKNWEYGYRCYIDFEMTCDGAIEDLSGQRLATYIWNNYKDDIYKGKYYSKFVNGELYHRYSKILLERGYVLTGYCMDWNLLQPLYEFLECPKNITFADLMAECLDAWIEACDQDYQDYFSFENFIEEAEANGWEFLENGKLFK